MDIRMNYIKYFSINTKGRDFVCGDIHGCLDKLHECLAFVNFDYDNDRLFAVGDLIDRGFYSFECLVLIEEPWFNSNRGNHEEMMLSSLYSTKTKFTAFYPQAWYPNGGDWHLSHVKRYGEISHDLLEKVANLPLISVVETKKGRVNIVHAEFAEGTTDKDIDDLKFPSWEQLLWGRERFDKYKRYPDLSYFDSVDNNLSKTIVGHTPVYNPIRIGKYRYIDGGCVFHGMNDKLFIFEL